MAQDARAFAFFDVAAQVWRVEAGAFEVSVGLSSAEARPAALIWRGRPGPDWLVFGKTGQDRREYRRPSMATGRNRKSLK